MKTQIERAAAIHCLLSVANKAMKKNAFVLANLKKLTKTK